MPPICFTIGKSRWHTTASFLTWSNEEIRPERNPEPLKKWLVKQR